jgi:hypothetical protein
MKPEDIVFELKKNLEAYGIRNWKVELTDLTDFYIRIEQARRLILVSKNFNWDFANFDNTLAHEIEGHVLRAVNMAKQKDPIFRQPLPFYIKTEEGLASFLGDYCSTTAEIARKHHAPKYIAGMIALKGTFIDVYRFFIKNGFTPELAFQRTFRLKRGFEDTSLYGVFAREAMYYEGMMEVKDYIDSQGDVKLLFSGKFGLDDLSLAPLLDKVIVPKRLYDYIDSRKVDN